jgi:hypothetical protein
MKAHKISAHSTFIFRNMLLKLIHFVNSVCTTFTLWKRDPSHQTFPSHQSWHQLSFYENKILVQNFLLNEWILIGTLKSLISDFLNSNMCFCSRLYGLQFGAVGCLDSLFLLLFWSFLHLKLIFAQLRGLSWLTT